MKALILAGAEKEGPLAQYGPNKALIKIHGKEMIRYIIDAFKGLDFIDSIAVVGPKESLEPIKGQVDVIVDSAASLADNVLCGVNIFSDDEMVLIATSDIPMITPEAVRDFVEKSLSMDADFYYPIVSREENEKKYPGIKRTYVKIKDGTFTGGNIVMVRAGKVKECIKNAEAFMTYRKKPWMLARILGLKFILKFLMGTLTIDELQERVEELFGVKARAIISSYPEIATDVDKDSDLELAARALS
ncbi:MAG: nucleotidyltransferase family protein [Tepidanaerobacteraceae bacterium]|jgi:GTP:adenosylcobinamide-phosphate guanylyltransferase|nr:NTP transferase domain-containing protein [Tepidanaerobacter sp.]HQA59403.1 nucleotidyltransferase family protein [Tepidanaerobacteraceae bacterium]HQE05624.1 nucleotidyltransferase family protein [Tepidanaerobacteraceae bacterium]